MTYIQTQFTVGTITTDLKPPTAPEDGQNHRGIDFLKELGDFLHSIQNTVPEYRGGHCGCGTVSPPIREDSCHPRGTLKVDEQGVITTPGGYKVEQLGQYDWKITGPDGKWTRCWGDPHVQESDRACDSTAWDFKRDSTFVLPDGTRINVSTKPYNNMTVTSQLEVINGRDRVLVTDIDKGKGKVGEVTHDGLDHLNNLCGRDEFVMGKETDDWYFHGREIIGSNNGGDSFKLGERGPNGSTEFLNQLEGYALRLISSLFRNWPTGSSEESERCRDRLADRIDAVNELFRAISRLRNLDDRLNCGRISFQC
jgi:hypothetical protein